MKELFSKVSEKVSVTRDAVMDNIETGLNFDGLSEKFSGMSDAAKEKSAQFTSDLISLSPIIEEIGFKTNGITINMGLPPDVTFHFEKFKDIDPARKDAIMEQHKEKLMLRTIVKALMTADAFQDKLKMGSFEFSTIDLCVGLTPGVSIQLVPKIKGQL